MDEPFSSSTPLTGFEQYSKSDTDRSDPVDLWKYERALFLRGFKRIVGIDEAGRGPIAGPVVAACIILPENFDCTGINDSKALTPGQRQIAFDRLQKEAICFTIGLVDPEDIDRINILKATHLAMARAVQALTLLPEVILIDGLPVPPMAECEHLAIVGGDAISVSIAAASIIAKVSRDKMMKEFALIYPEYGFDRHKGYSSREHLDAVHKHGPCPIHRKSFSPISSFAEATLF